MLKLQKRNKLLNWKIKYLNVFILCFFIFLSTACQPDIQEPQDLPASPSQSNIPKTPHESPFKQVHSPVHFVYMIENPLVTDTVTKDLKDGFGETYAQVRGYKDKNLQKSINEKIKTFHDSRKQLTIPPYRGIKRVITEEYELKEHYINTYPTFNFNNLLSLASNSSLVYSNGDPSKDIYLDFTETLTLDLATGETVHFEDLFVNDANYEKIINDYIKIFLEQEFSYEEYREWFGSVELVAPFKGISENPKFFLSYNTLVLLLDSQTPEFNTQYNTQYLNIPYLELKDILAIEERFSADVDNLYLDENTPNITMISSYDKYVTGKSYQENKNGVDYYINYRYAPAIPQSIVDDFITHLDPNETPPDYVRTVYKEGSISFTGEYISASIAMNYSGPNEQFVFRNFFSVYSPEGEVLTIEKVFKPDFDYKPVIMSLLEDSISYEQKKFDPNVDELYESLTFRISGDGLYFTTKPVKSSEKEESPIQFGLPFKEIGLDHLIFFD